MTFVGEGLTGWARARARRWLPAILGALLLALVACGGEPPFSRSAGEGQGVRAVTGGLSTREPDRMATPAPSPTLAATFTPSRTAAPAAPPVGLVLVASERNQSLTLVDATTNQITRTISLGVPAHTITVGPDGRTAWVFSGRRRESDIYFVDLAKGERQGSKRLRDGPHAVAFSRDGSRAYVALADGNGVSFLKTASRDPFGLVQLGRQTEGVGIPRRPHALAVLPGPPPVSPVSNHALGNEVLYVAGHGSGVVWALDAGSGGIRAEVEVGGGPALLLPDPTGSRVYALVDTLNQLVGVDATTQQVASRLPLPGRPASAAIGPGGVVAVTAGDADEVWIVELATGAIAARVRVGSRPAGVAFSTDGGRVYVASSGDDTLTVIDVPTRRVVATVPVGPEPVAVTFAGPVNRSVTPTPTSGKPSPTPTMVPTPTPLPRGAFVERLPPGTVKEVFVPGAEFSAAMAFAPDGRLFYAELRTGKIRVVERGTLRLEPFYDFAVAGQPETGLLGIAVDPDFARNHYLYAFYTSVADGGTSDGPTNGPNHVVRLTDVNGKGTDLTPIISDLPSGQVHNGGSLRFGPDGKLYVTVGETGDMGLSQDLSSPAGKILRVNPDGSIPTDNPFVGQTNRYAAIWASGFRNPFDLDFHPISGAVVAGESGPGDNDELNLVVRGGNYGWPPSGFRERPDLVDPIAVFNPVISPVGLAFYRGEPIREWQNDLFYCNFHQGQLRRVHLAPGSFDRIVFEETVTTGCTLDVATGPDGALYYSDLHAIYRIRRAGAAALPAIATVGPPVVTATPSLAQGLREQDRDVNVNLTEWKVTLSRNVVPSGKIRFLAENLGETAHALRIVGNGVEVRTPNFGPGGSRLLEVDLPPGVYTLDCPIRGHPEQGMVVKLRVLRPGSAESMP
ncbi:MAG: PQQ-dependent sugar dehydrogenase [Chloroflexi bacterium]|nr:PQQ-dependent sugar dehydrogenase [Chloroflexota bacterium]